MNIFDHPDWTAIAVAAAAALVLAFAGGALTDVGAWYQGLRKPSWQPPNWVFAPVWTTIFVLAAWAAVAAWHLAPDSAARTLLVTLYVINGILNVAWSLLFFRGGSAVALDRGPDHRHGRLRALVEPALGAVSGLGKCGLLSQPDDRPVELAIRRRTAFRLKPEAGA